MIWEIWVGAAISFPVSIAASLAAPAIQQWIVQRWHTSRETKRNRLKDEYEDVLFYALHTDMMLGKLMVSVIIMISLTIVAIIVGATSTVLGAALGVLSDHILRPSAMSAYRVPILISLVSLLVAITTTIATRILRFANRYIKLFYNVINLKEFAESIPEDLRDTDREMLVSHAKFDRAIPGFNSAKKHLIDSYKKKDQAEASDGGTLSRGESQD